VDKSGGRKTQVDKKARLMQLLSKAKNMTSPHQGPIIKRSPLSKLTIEKAEKKSFKFDDSEEEKSPFVIA
jgi:hypothetical protein